MKKPPLPETLLKDTHAFVLAVVLALVAWIAWALWGARWLLSIAMYSGDEATKLGQVGDVFGGVNALFTALAFAGVIWTAVLQRRELHAQREELRETRGVLAKQGEVLSRQAFESIFFALMRLFREISDGLQIRVGAELRGEHGAEAIAVLKNALYQEVVPQAAALLKHSKDEVRANLEALYEATVYSDNEIYLGPYYRSLYHVFKLIDRADFGEELKAQYANIATAQLGPEALFLLAINVLTEHGQNFKPLVEKYGVLKHIGREDLKPFLAEFFEPEAFESYEQRKARAAAAHHP